jgi:hypothetical protein
MAVLFMVLLIRLLPFWIVLARNSLNGRQVLRIIVKSLRSDFAISHDGKTVQFGFEEGGKRPARFSLSEQRLILNPPLDISLTPS